MANKYSNLKIFHYKEKLDSLKANIDDIKPPIHIRIKPTNVCNHNCWFCAYKAKHLQLGADMIERDYIPKDKMIEILDDCKDMGVKAITFSGGGEPFVYKYFLESIQRLIKHNISFSAITNGSKLKGEIADLFAINATWIRISIDGFDKESYSKSRHINIQEFDKVISNMKDFASIKNRKCNLGVSAIIDDKNYHKIYDFSMMMKDIGVDSIKLSGCIVDNDREKNNIYHKPFFDKAKKLCIKIKQDLQDDSFEVFDSYHYLDDNFQKDYKWCPYLQILPIIGADLNIYPCQDKAYNIKEALIGSIKDRSFKDFWFDDKNKFFKINPSMHCKNHCVANNKNKMILDYLNTEHLGFV
jgi:MoaA/NifB/PqqE/SkfB family radical SAM enzyme